MTSTSAAATDETERRAVERLMARGAGADEIDLSVGQPDLPVDPVLVRAGIAALTEGRTGYTPKLGLDELRTAIAIDIEASTGYRPSDDDVVVTVGGTEAVAVALETVCRAGDAVLIPDPAWPNYRVLADSLGIHVDEYRQGATGIEFADLDAIEEGLRRGAKLVVVNSPSNPVGAVADAALLRSIVALARRYDAYVLSDEAYESIVFGGGRAASPLADGGEDRVFSARTFSKSYSMTGIRVGALVSPPAFRSRVAAIHGTTVGCAPIVGQYMVLAALETGTPDPTMHSDLYAARFEQAVSILGPWLPQRASDGLGGFYLWIDGTATGRTGAELTARLRQDGIVVSAGEVYSTRAGGHFRIALTEPADVLDDVLTRVRALLDSLG